MRITLIACLLVAARAQPSTLSCSQLCKSGMDPRMWDKHCDCAIEEARGRAGSGADAATGRSGLSSDGVYYEPAADMYLRGLSFVNPPFYIINPTIKLKIEASEPKLVFKRKIQHHGESEFKTNSKHTTTEYGNYNHATDDGMKSTNLYLDIDVDNSAGTARSAIKHDTNKLTEQEFSECINLHLLAYSRTHHKQNRKKHDLLAQMRDECNQPAKIVKQSLEEIKKRLPKIRDHLDQDNLNYTSININENQTEKKHVKFYESSEDIVEEHGTLFAGNSSLNRSHFVNSIQIENQQRSGIHNNNTSMEDNQSSETTQYVQKFTTEATVATTQDLSYADIKKIESGHKLRLNDIIFVQEESSEKIHGDAVLNQTLTSAEESQFHEGYYESSESSLLNESVHNILLNNAHKTQKGGKSYEISAEIVHNQDEYNDQDTKASSIDVVKTSIPPLEFLEQFRNHSVVNKNTTENQTISLQRVSLENNPIAEFPSHNKINRFEEFISNSEVAYKSDDHNEIKLNMNNEEITSSLASEKTAKSESQFTLHETVERTINKPSQDYNTENVFNENSVADCNETISTESTLSDDSTIFNGTATSPEVTDAAEQIGSASTRRIQNRIVIDQNENVEAVNEASSNSDSKGLKITDADQSQGSEDLQDDTDSNKSQYHSENIAPKPDIAQIITREFDNDTVISSFNGEENESVTAATFIQPQILRNSIDQSNEQSHKQFMKNDESITGKLFFLFDKAFVPAKFVQDNNGELSVAIDGETLCDKLNYDNNNSSILINTLCSGLSGKSCIRK